MNKYTYLLLPLLLTACSKPTPPSDAIPYKTITIERADRTLLSEYSARLTGQQVVEVRPQVSGLITKICAHEGERVKKGQLLFVIDQVPYQAAYKVAQANVASAEASLANATLTLENTEKLYAGGVVGDYDLSTARNNAAAAQAALAQAEAQEISARNDLSYTEVRSPVDGTAGMIAYRVGALVSSSITDPLMTVSDNSTVYAYFSLTEAQVVDLIERYGSVEALIENMPEISLKTSSGNTYGQKGRLGAVSGIVSEGTNAITLRADFPNPNGILHEGGSASVIVPTTCDSAIVIPQTATFELQDKIFVYKVIDGKATSAPVQVFRLNDGAEYVVEDGLENGDVIIADGAGLVREGAAVKQ